MWLTRLFLVRPTLIFVSLALLAFGGTLAWLTLPRQQFPNVDFPIITVTATYGGASAAEIRDTIVRPLEDHLTGAPSLDHLDATVQQGTAVLRLTFSLASNKNTDLVEVQKRVQAAQAELPADVRAPEVASFDPSQSPVVEIAASSQRLSPDALASIVTQRIVPQLEQTSGVAFVQVQGAVQPALLVSTQPATLAAHGLTIDDLISAIHSSGTRAPGGYLTGPDIEKPVDVRGDITGPASLARLSLGAPSAGTRTSSTTGAWSVSPERLHVGDVATVRESYERVRSYAFVGGRRAIVMDVLKASGASEVSVANATIARLPALRAAFPGVAFGVTHIQARFTAEQIESVSTTLVQGVALTSVVMMLFLGSWRNAVVVLVAIPASLCIDAAALRLLQYTLDTVTLTAMTLVIGILVDDSIVVLENIARRRSRGDAPFDAALRGRSEIGTAAVVVTLVDVVVFLPIAFLPGETGRILSEFGVTVAVATLASLAVAFTITPALAGTWSLRSRWRTPRVVRRFEAAFDRVRRWYVHRALPWALRRGTAVMLGCLAVFAGSIALVPLGVVGAEFMSPTDRGEITIQVTLRPGAPVDATAHAMQRIQRFVESLGSDVEGTTAIAGSSTAQAGPVSESTLGQVSVYLTPRRRHTTAFYVGLLGRDLPGVVPGTRIDVIPATDVGGGVTQPINYTVSSGQGTDLVRATNAVAAALAATPGATSVISGAADLIPGVEVRFDREAVRTTGVSIGTAATSIRATLGEIVAGQYLGANGSENIDVTGAPSTAKDAAAIAAIALRTSDGHVVHAGDVARVTDVLQTPVIERENRRTGIRVSANVADGFAASVVQAGFLQRVARLALPADVRVAPSAGGPSDTLAQTIAGMALAFGSSLVLTYLLMVALFDGYRAPAIIFFSLPMAAVGAIGSLAVTHQSLNLFSMIGAIMLVGLVMKNGILMVDRAQRERRRGRTPLAAIVRAAHVRFRPVIMTTIAMIVGMLPLALGLDPGGASRRSLGTIVIGGLTSSLLLTLVLVPLAYLWLTPRRGAPDDASAVNVPLTWVQPTNEFGDERARVVQEVGTERAPNGR